MATEPIIARVRKIITLAERASTPAEAEQAWDKAYRLMAQHNINEAEIEQAAPESSEPVRVDVPIHGPYPLPKIRLLGSLMTTLGGRAIRNTTRARDNGKTTTTYTVALYGFPNDIALVQLLFSRLLLQMQADLAATPIPAGETPRSFKGGFLASWGHTVAKRFHQLHNTEVHQAENTSGGGVSLVLAERTDRVQRLVDAQFPRVGKARRSRYQSKAGILAGHRSGMEASLGEDTSLDQTSRGALDGRS
ncbi:DUF2786 domain-containing protein (plasmid) [Nocardiopsis exhalans]|uniref:DUF2786 domain-containing protein n=1 Tax=Nocardiopsis exhalans TaxID=163604 RepID=A0ABY5DGW7_9ACTN|nr:DUF2786 domain-containing protein [Nocardiopsis exhalans]USY23569.1 DUF2786 domain-containing protein [Nocardiopsis exhalans]